MFETLQELEDDQIDVAADQLAAGGMCLILLDPSGVFCAVTPCPDYEVDFACVKKKRFGDGYKPHPLTPLQHAVMLSWAKKTIPALCRRWRERSEDSHEEGI